MRYPRWLIFAILILFTASCVPNRKYVYLQKDDLHKKDNPLDTVVRTHSMKIKEYLIQPLDILSIRIESLTEDEFDFMAKLYPVDQLGAANQANLLVNGFLIDNDGDVEFPVIGKLRLAGLSVFEAEELLQKSFEPFLKNPVARVRLLNFRFTVLGEVNREQQINAQNPRVTVMEAIGLAGGLTDLADRSNVKIIRQKGDSAQVYYLNLLTEDVISSDHFYIQQNDVIVVSALRQRPYRRYFGQNLALLVSTISVVLLTISLTTN